MVNIKKKLSNIYKNLVITLFKIIYGKIIFVEKPQKEKEILVEEGNLLVEATRVEMWVKRHPLDRPGNGRRAHRQIPPAT